MLRCHLRQIRTSVVSGFRDRVSCTIRLGSSMRRAGES
jgi:hypothetical protein